MRTSRDIRLFIISIVLLVICVSGFLWYHAATIQQLEETISELSTTVKEQDALLTEKLTDVQTEQSQQGAQLALVESTLQEVANIFTEEDKKIYKAVNSLNLQLDNIRQQSDTKIELLTSQLENLQIESEQFSAIIEDAMQATVSIGTNKGLGSGVIVTKDGYVVTNHHVVDGITSAGVKTENGKIYPMRIVGQNEKADIAVIKIKGNFEYLEFTNDVVIGQHIIALGNPYGFDFTVTEGIISARRTIEGVRYLQTDVSINPGNSGGPIVDIRKRVAGITTWKVGGSQGIGFAVDSRDVEEFVEDIIAQDRANQS